MSGLDSTEKVPHYHFHQLELKPEDDHQSSADFPTSQNLYTPEQIPSTSSVANFDKKLSPKCSSETVSNGISPKLNQMLFGVFKKEVAKSDGIQCQKREEVTKSQQEDQCDTRCQSDAEKSFDKTVSDKKENAASPTPEARTLALQKTPLKETMISEDGGMDLQAPERVTDLRAIWEKESTASQTHDDTNQSNFTNVGTLPPADPTTACDVDIITNIGSDSLKMTADDSVDSSHGGSSLSIPISKEDGTYRAKPVIIYEETDESLTSSSTETHICEPRENTICPGPSLLRTVARGEITAPNPFSFEDNSPVKVSQCDENAMSSETIYLSVSEDNPICEMTSAETDQRASSDSTKNSVLQRQMSPGKAKLYTMLKTSRMSSKGFVSPDSSPLKSSSAAQQMQPAHSQSSPYTQVQQRPVSPCKSATPRPREQGERRSPSKTCHPKALPREPSGTKASSLEGSPLKTFQINIEPRTKTVDEEHVKPTPVPRQRRSPSHEVKEENHADTNRSTDCCLSDPPSNPEERGAGFGPDSLRSSTPSPQSKRALPISPTSLARSHVPQDYEHYLGPQEKAYIPPFHSEKRNTAESDVGHRNPPDSSTISYVGQNQDKTTKVYSLSRASLSSELLSRPQHLHSFRIFSVM